MKLYPEWLPAKVVMRLAPEYLYTIITRCKRLIIMVQITYSFFLYSKVFKKEMNLIYSISNIICSPSHPPPPAYVLQMITTESYSFAAFGQVVVVSLVLNQSMTALTILIICASPDYSVYLSTIVTTVAGFTAGFFIPIDELPWW